METLDYWKICDELTVVQAALLIVGVDPSTIRMGTEAYTAEDRPRGYDAVLAALGNAIKANRLPARLRTSAREYGYAESVGEDEAVGLDDGGARIVFKVGPNWLMTTVSVDDLRNWLRTRGITTGFFFPGSNDTVAEYLNPTDEHYAPKLAAAVSAWQAVAHNPKATKGKSAKKAITNWLTTHASRFGLIKPDGSPNEQGIEEIAKVANWASKGGAPKTPRV